MKINKSILFVGLALVTLIMGVTSCSTSTEETDKKSENKTENKDNIEYSAKSDSLATAIGAGMGGSVNNQIKTITDSAYLAKLSKDEIVEGVDYVLAVDTTNEGHLAGLNVGLQLNQQVQYFEKENIKINRKVVVDEFKKALKREFVDMNELMNYQSQLSDYSSISDSTLTVAIGAGMGGSVNNQIKTITDSAYLAKLSKDEVVKGVDYVLVVDKDNEGRFAGLGIGLQLIQQLQYFEKEGVKINRELVIEQFEKALMQDSVPMAEIEKHSQFIEATSNSLQQEKARKLEEELEKSPEAIQGTKTGEAFINKKKQEDAEIKTTASGLSYKIINEGEGAKATDNDYVKVIYKGSLIDGTVFDDSNGEAREFPVSGVVSGFAEGIKLLGKGGKAILYIPGKLAYGAQGQPYAGIGPNQMLIFEVEVTDITTNK